MKPGIAKADTCKDCGAAVLMVPAYGGMKVACDPSTVKVLSNGLDGWATVEGHLPHFETCRGSPGDHEPTKDNSREDLGYN